MDFKEFSKINEGYFDSYDSYIGDKSPKVRRTELAKSLEKVRSRIKSDLAREYEYEDKPWRSPVKYDAVSFFAKKAASLGLDVAAEVADLFGGALPKGKKPTDKDYKESFEDWKENLSPKTSKEDLESYMKDAQKIGLSRFGKGFDINNPRNQEEKDFASYYKKGEKSILGRLF